MLVAAVGQAAGTAVQPAVEASKGLYGYVKDKYKSAKNIHQNYDKLLEKAEFLVSREKDVRRKILSKQATMEPTHECVAWLNSVEAKKEVVLQLEMSYKKEKDGSCGFFRLFRRSKLSEDLLRMSDSVVALRDQMNPESKYLVRKDMFAVERKPVKELNDVPSVAEHVEKLLNFLKNEEVKRIGIHGIYGVGKTTIMKSLHRRVDKDGMFDIVIWVTASKGGSIPRIQKAILERLNAGDEVSVCEDQMENLIFKVLAEKKYLLLLDEVNSVIELDRIGIGHDHGKVVLASRSKVICQRMELDDEYEVQSLSNEDSWKLFRDTVGDEANNPLLKSKATLILKHSGGLPQVIKAVGKYLKKNLSEGFWSSTLTSLQSHKSYPLGHMQAVFDAFKLVYDELRNDLKFSLLYSASFPEDHEIYRDHLIECWKAEQLIPDDETLRRARDSGECMLQLLIDSHMFDHGKSKKFVKMPILFRNAALRMANEHSDNRNHTYGDFHSASHKVFELFVNNTEEVGRDYLSALKWESARVISLIHTDIQNLPDSPECRKISTLFLQKSRNLTTLHGSFFSHMPGLKVLDLYGTGIESLPLSISKLSNLRVLYLNDCHRLTMLPDEIKHLKDLEVLDISGTRMYGLPIVVGDLTNLRCLRASFTAFMCNGNSVAHLPIEVIPPNTLNKLCFLEELSLGIDPTESRWNAAATTIAAEVAKLEMLTTISFYFPNIGCLETFWISLNKRNARAEKGFRSFKLLVGSYETGQAHKINIAELSASRHLRYSDGVDIPKVMKEVLKQACVFELIAHQNILSLSDFGVEQMGSLQLCIVEECNEMTTIVGSGVLANPVFHWLKELRLCRLQKLNGISDGPVAPGSFSWLTTLSFYDCPSMMKILCFEITRLLSRLKHLRVEECPRVIEIMEEAQNPYMDTLPSLEILELVNLQGLVQIYHGESFEWPALHKVEIIGCGNLTCLSLGIGNAPKLHSIRCSETWWSEVAVLENEVREHLVKFCRFIREE